MHPVDQLLLLSFQGDKPPPDLLDAIGRGAPGFTFFREHNDVDAPRILELADEIWAVAGDLPPVVAVDHEGGQLEAAGAAATSFPGAMALGAAGDLELTERVGAAMAIELRALGFTVNFAPDADLASNPANPAAGTRTFGDDPTIVGRQVAALVRGLQSNGVAATLKHFPGSGDASVDTHHQPARIDHPAAHVRDVDAAPFRAGIGAGATLVMSGHHALPAVTGSEDLPCTLSHRVMTGLLRDELGFEGVAITDALDMKALDQEGVPRAIDLIAAVMAGNDLLLATPVDDQISEVRGVLRMAADRGVITAGRVAEAASRTLALRSWLAGFDRPDPSVVRSSEHRDLAAEVARRSITRVRGVAAPLAGVRRVLVIEPRPETVTPADTSAWVPEGGMAAALSRHMQVDSIVVPPNPEDGDVAAAVHAAEPADAVVVATANGHFASAQGALARAVLDRRPDAVTAALRVPWDLWAYPRSTAHWSSYSIHGASLEALAAALTGAADAAGRMPVSGVA